MTGTSQPSRPNGGIEESGQSSKASYSTPQHPKRTRMLGASGGVADKLGNKYELGWAIRHALLCIRDERRSLVLEEIDPDLACGSEFTYINEHGVTSVTQVKRQNNITDHWTIAALRSLGVLAAAAHHVAAGREFHFSSMTPSGALRVMADLSRQSENVQQFVAHQLTSKTRPVFDELTAPNVFESADRAWQTLRGMYIEIEVEEHLCITNSTLADLILEGATGDLTAVAIGAVLLDNLRRRMTQRELLDALARDGITPRGAQATLTSHEQVATATQSWRGTIERELLTPTIERQEAATLIDLMTTTRLALVVGAGGGGKSSVLYQAARKLEARDAEVLAFRLDRRGAFGSTMELGVQLGLSISPVAALRQAADGRDAFLIIDQLDAVSLASGRLSERYDVIADLIQEATAVEGVRVILACRQFDVENDHRIRKLDARNDVERLTVEPLSGEATAHAVAAMGLDPGLLTVTQRALLRSPMNLVLLETIADQPGALNFTSRGSLFEAFWLRKEQTSEERRPGTLFNDVLARIANNASENQTLSVPVDILGPGDFIKHARVLASEQVIAIDDDRVSFFHETFFDFTFARQWLSRQQSMVDFLCAQEQELFRRAQVRQILELLRERDPNRFRTEVEAVLNNENVRFHIKETVAAVFANIGAPTVEDVDLALRLTVGESTLTNRLLLQLARPAWFGPFDSQGHIESWLDSDNAELRNRSVNWMGNAGAEHGDRVAELLQKRHRSPDYVAWLRSVTWRVELHQHRRLFELFLKAVRAGDIDPADQNVWYSVHDLVNHKPPWAVEMLKACLADSPCALALGDDGKVALLGMQEYGVTEMIKAACKAEPQAFAEAFVPHLLMVMEATADDRHEQELFRDRHFCMRLPMEPGYGDVDDALFNGAADALGQWAQVSPDTVESMLQLLAASEYDAAQSVLYRALVTGAENFAPWAAELVLQGGNRLKAGYISDVHWLAREVVEAIAPIVSDEVHLLLEELFRDLPATYISSDLHHRLRSYGYTAFEFLSALDRSRLSPLGLRRLQEYQRKFDRDSPEPPTGIISYVVGPPISSPSTGKMSNAQWLQAMAKHDHDDRDFGSETGGARELAQQLEMLTAEDPRRFAGLAMQLTPDINEAYPSAILGGFGEASIPDEALPALFDAIRHVMNLGHDNCDRWLGWAVRQVLDETPLDIVELVLDRALHASNPVDNSPIFVRQDDHKPGRDLHRNGINTSRGTLAESLGDLLVHDPDGARTELVAPHLAKLANDPVLSVRACVAHTIAACLRNARSAAYAAFERLIDANDLLLASDRLDVLMIYIGNANPEVIDPVIGRMLSSPDAEVRKAGGRMAAYGASQWGRPALMERALAGDVDVRRGLAEICAARVDMSADSELVLSTLRQLMHDEDDDVRKLVGTLAGYLRGASLRPYADVLSDLIVSPSYIHATPQLFITLQHAPDRVDDLADLAAHQFLNVHGEDAANFTTGAAGDAHYISDLVIRGLAQTRTQERVKALLDILDRMLALGVYGVDRAIDEAVRK
ncbi:MULTISPECIES: hypothetical protein [unclassified Rhodococcus (in: high G+C Gram-positive bacteria)]|uniref:hypothetical protein n=1 Tax=unclassified Rhodococcus (in: high G+C Gram-positive bacteria) TaxID=192944 RepID=UPI0019111E90|nr:MULTISPECIES: hypothetical protein [unclassified Rhodococcus (in: high G+C Gram-positive bacteria)]